MATKDLGNIDPDIFNCTICLERFRKPKYLPCLHTFCQPCLNTYILSSTRESTTPPTSFNCPICREEVKPPQESSPIEKWAELMPLNHMIYSLMDSSGTTKQAEDRNCNHCEQDDEIVKAVFRCLECRENLCETCRKYHNRQKANKYHRVVPISELKPEDVEVADVEEPCKEHKGEMMKVYCVDHREMCCVICLSVNHRKCEHVKTFDEMAEIMKKNEDVKQIKNKITDMCSNTEALLVHKNENINSIEMQHQNILTKTSNIVEETKRKLDHFHETFKKQFSLIHKDHSTKLSNKKDRLEHFQKFLSHCEKTLVTVTEYGSPQQTFVTLEKIRRRLDIQGKELEELLKDDKDISYKLVLNKHLTKLNASMSSLAEIELHQTPHDKLLVLTTGAASGGIKNLQRQVKSADIGELDAVKIWDVNTGGWITSGLFLDSGNVMCANMDMKNISVYDTEGKLLIKHPLDFAPWGICQSSDGCELYVSDDDAKQIRVYTMADKNIKEVKRIQTKTHPFTINITGGKMLVQQGDYYNYHSKTIQTMTLDAQNNREICECSCYSGIAVSTYSGESRFYYCEDKAVICRTLDGTEVFRHQLQGIDDPAGVALDAADNVYVCGRNSKNIHVIAKDGSSSRVFLSTLEPVYKPFAIGFDKTGTKFFVTDYENNKNISVYNLSLRNNP